MAGNTIESIQKALIRIGSGDYRLGPGMVIRINHAESLMRAFLRTMFGDSYVWLPEYNTIVEWLTDNNSKGLMLMGNCGVGKTVMCCYVIPGIMLIHDGKVYKPISAHNLHERMTALKFDELCIIDDIGVEVPGNEYGIRHEDFVELVDFAENQKKILILTTNLNAQELAARYGERVMDRLRGLVRCIPIPGNSLRGKSMVIDNMSDKNE